MSNRIGQILDLKNNSANCFNYIREAAQLARISLKNVAYAKDTSEMYNDMKITYSKFTQIIENAACVEKTVLNFDNTDCNKLNNTPFLYQRISSDIKVNYKNGVLTVESKLENLHKDISWRRKYIGIEIKIINSNDIYLGEEIASKKQDIFVSSDSQEINISKVTIDIQKDAELYSTEPSSPITICVTPYLKIDDKYLYFYDNSIQLSCLRNSEAHYPVEE